MHYGGELIEMISSKVLKRVLKIASKRPAFVAKVESE
jgi:hypothetical protein